MKTCKVKDCTGKHLAKGYCLKHYKQIRRNGKILKRTRLTPNEIIIKGNIAEIVIYNINHQEIARAIVDTEDICKIKKYRWRLCGGRVANSSATHRIQHLITGIKSNMEIHIDHIDRNPLNNRKSNLRICTNKENSRNSGMRKNNTSGYKGVWKNWKRWEAGIKVNGAKIYLGLFKTKQEAAIAYNKAAFKYFGEFACFNKI